MRYTHASIGSALLPKIIGSYEEPIHAWIEDAIELSYRTIYVIGAAEGYYAVGLARAIPTAQVTAFETSNRGRELLGELARINSVSVESHGTATVDSLKLLKPKGPALFIMDVEGAERTLLDPSIGSMERSDIIVETHDFLVPFVTRQLVKRFETTHRIELAFDYAWRNATYVDLRGERIIRKEWFSEERRPGSKWLRLRARAR